MKLSHYLLCSTQGIFRKLNRENDTPGYYRKVHNTPFFGHQNDCQATKQNEWRDNSSGSTSISRTQGPLLWEGVGSGSFSQTLTGKGRKYPHSIHHFYLVALLPQVNETILKLDTLWIFHKLDLYRSSFPSTRPLIGRNHGILFLKGSVWVLLNQSKLDF